MVQKRKQKSDWEAPEGRFLLFVNQWESLLVWTLGAYIVMVPSISFFPSVSPFNEKRALQIGLMIVIGLAFLISQKWRQRWLSTFGRLPSSARWMLAFVLGLGLLSSALAPAPFYAFLEVGHFLLLFVLAGVVATVVQSVPKQSAKILLGLVVVSGLLYTVHFFAVYAEYLAAPDVDLWTVPEFQAWPDRKTNFANIRFFNHYQTLTLPLLAGSVLAVPKRLRLAKLPLFGVMVLWWALIYASNVRGTILAMIVATLGVVLLFRSKAKKWILVQLLGFLLGLGLFYLLFSTGSAPSVVDKVSDASTYSRRLQHWQRCLEMAWTHPLLGAGPMHFAWPPYHYAITASPHNTFMQWSAEWGVSATITISGLALWGIWSWIRQERTNFKENSIVSGGVSVGLVAAVIAGATHSMVSGLTLAPLSQMLFVLVGGWAWGRYQFRGEDDPSTDSFFWAHIILCALLASSVLVVGNSFRDLASATERRVAFMNSVERNKLSPRYWTQGYIGVRDSSVIERARRDR
jgi:O-antigen ligase